MLLLRRIVLPAVLGLLLTSVNVEAQALPAARGIRSAEVLRPGTTVRRGPGTRRERRGTVQVGTRLPFLGRVQGDGCPGGEWAHVGSEAFICESLLRYSALPPAGDALPRLPQGQLIPRNFAFVRTDGTWAYARPSDYFYDQWVESLGQGFGVAVTETRSVRGIEMARTMGGLWIPSAELRFARPSDFAGVELNDESRIDEIAWVIREHARIHERPRGRVQMRASRLQRVRIVEERGRYARLADGGWMSLRDLRRPSVASPPEELQGDGRWIDVDLEHQILTAYVGDRPIFATLVSTGRPRTPTREGVFRIWVKLAEDDMTNLQRDDVARNYAIQSVPWVQYFDGSIGLHAAFWHDRFGIRRSHGCVNLSARDARYLFAFTQPNLPVGWDAIVSTDSDRGTIVRVR